MGWTVFNGMPRGGMQKAIDDEINSGGCKVVESVFLGRDYYAAVRTPEGAVIAAVAIVEGSGYKLMDESMNPYYYSCPAKILDMLTPAPEAWPGSALGQQARRVRDRVPAHPHLQERQWPRDVQAPRPRGADEQDHRQALPRRAAGAEVMAAPKPWTGVKGPTGRAWMWIHQDPSVPRVKHCGHPTALRPYYMPELLWELGAFPNLKHAQKAAELAAVARRDGEDLEDESVGWAIRRQALGLPADTPMPQASAGKRLARA